MIDADETLDIIFALESVGEETPPEVVKLCREWAQELRSRRQRWREETDNE